MTFLYMSDGMIHKIVANLPWSQAKEVKKASIMEKTKKNVALEASLFRLTTSCLLRIQFEEKD